MSNELIIDSAKNGCRIALLKDKRLVEFHQDKKGNTFNVGDVFLGTVKKVMTGLNAAFVDIGYEKDAFLHYLDLGPQVKSLHKFCRLVHQKAIAETGLSSFDREPDIDKLGKIDEVLKKGQKILVQVLKEPISTKGPKLTSEISLPGRHVVLIPFSKAVNVSKKITNVDERKRLHRLVTSIRPDGFGVIVRTVAEGKEGKELNKDIQFALSKWNGAMQCLDTFVPGDKVIGEMNRANSILRDILNESFDSIVVDEKSLFREINTYVHQIAPEKSKITKLYSGKKKVFEEYGIEKQIKTSFGKKVNMPNGGYLILEHTEALHVIDVNSGNKSNVESSQEETAVMINMEAAKETARQLRLRDMGGIIVIDFIDMKRAESRKALFMKVKEEMKEDRSKHTILPLSKFGLMEITRQRVRPEMAITTQENCPACEGTGKISASIQIADKIQDLLKFIMLSQNQKNVTLLVHPYLKAFFTKGLISDRVRWLFKYSQWVKIVADSSLAINEYRLQNKFGQEIDS